MKKFLSVATIVLLFCGCAELKLPNLSAINLTSSSMELPADITSAKFYPECKSDEANALFVCLTIPGADLTSADGWKCKFEQRMEDEVKRPNTTKQIAHKAGSWQKYRETIYKQCLTDYVKISKTNDFKKYGIKTHNNFDAN